MSNKSNKKLLIMILITITLMVSSNIFSEGSQEQKDSKEPTIQMGVLGVMSGSGASWGLVMRYCTETVAKMFNEEGGIDIDGTKYKIKVTSLDTKMDPRVAKTAMERLVYEDKVKYIVGTCIDDTTASSQPVLEAGGAINVTYGFAKELFQPPHYNTILGMPTPYTTAPIIYKYMIDNHDVKSISFIARNDADALYERKEGVQAAKDLGLNIISYENTYEPNTTDFTSIVNRVIRDNPDQIVLSGVLPGDAPLLIKSARQQGYDGFITTETSHDTKILNEIAGEHADGFICVGGANTPELRSKYMGKFVEKYKDIAGEWNDEAATKAYAPLMLLLTLQQAGEKAINDVEVFKDAIPSFSAKNPFLKEDVNLTYVGEETLGHPRQLGVPLVINRFDNGKFDTLFMKTKY